MKSFIRLIVLMVFMAVFYTASGYFIAFMLDKGFGYGHYYNLLVAIAIGVYLVILFSVIMGIAKEMRNDEERRTNQ